MKKKVISIILSSCLILVSSSIAFANTEINKTHTVNTTVESVKNEKIDNKYKTYTEDGKKYKAIKIEYKDVKPETIKKNYKDLIEKEVPKTIDEHGEKYQLEKAEYKEAISTKTEEYNNYVREPNIPKEKDFEINGKTVKGTLKNVTKSVSSTYNVPFSIPARFYGSPDVEVYILNGKEISSANAPEFNDYPNELLSYLNLDGNIYNIQSGRWNGGYYTDNNGQTVRNAIFTGMQKSNSYIATYDIEEYTAEATYISKDKVTAKAVITYEQEGLSFETKLLIGFAVVIGALTLAIILFILRRKQKSNE